VAYDDADSYRNVCVQVEWADGMFPYNPAPRAADHWQGTLLTEKRDASGLLYRRNRYYDPATDRFTQEDPIGLAGGVNVYGFAAGDPVSYSDPFGLCPFWMRLSPPPAAKPSTSSGPPSSAGPCSTYGWRSERTKSPGSCFRI
jgi:RHS repeat-associated protein